MIRTGFRAASAAIVALSVILAAACARGDAQNTPYPRMAPLQQYLMQDRAEIALAQSAAPSSISGHATIMVLTPHGYQIAKQGSNGFTCLVERGWTSPFDDREFWNSKRRAPVCYNEGASRTILPYTYKRTAMALAGLSKSQIYDRLVASIAGKQLPLPEPGSMAYMMSKRQYLTDSAGAWMAHVMFYTPKAVAANGGVNWGADLHGSPVIFDSDHHGNPEPWAVFFVPVAHWSDGSRAPLM